MTASAATVRVPATSANLGPGYDCFGLALARFDEVTARLTAGGIAVRVDGVGAGQVPLGADHLVVRAVAKAFDAAGAHLPGLTLTCTNSIPHAGGLGSSAAAIVAGLLLGRALLPPSAGPLDDDDILALATGMEGHPDNVAPALLGGFTLALTGERHRTLVVRRTVHPDVRAAVFVAANGSSTHQARAMLPDVVPHAEAAGNAAAAALLVHAITEDPRLLLPATVDRLHQDYRASAMPGSAQLMADLRADGVAAVISGAGPAVLALSTVPLELSRWDRPGFEAFALALSPSGATLEIA